MPVALTEEQFKAALPAGMQKSVNPLLMVKINNVLTNSEEAEILKENLVGFGSVLSQGKFTMNQYINAVKYVGYRVMGRNIKESYQSTFPDKVMQFQIDGVKEKDIASYSTAYNKSKLVNLLFEQTLVPTHIINAPLFQRAINTQAAIMTNPKASFKVQSDAADSLMRILKAPETKKVELDIGIDAGSIIDDYQEAMSKLVATQMKLIKAGGDLKTIANVPIVRKEVIDV